MGIPAFPAIPDLLGRPVQLVQLVRPDLQARLVLKAFPVPMVQMVRTESMASPASKDHRVPKVYRVSPEWTVSMVRTGRSDPSVQPGQLEQLALPGPMAQQVHRDLPDWTVRIGAAIGTA